jgi:hypothetical protein
MAVFFRFANADILASRIANSGEQIANSYIPTRLH